VQDTEKQHLSTFSVNIRTWNNALTDVLEELHLSAKKHQQHTKTGCANRMLLASGFVFLAISTLSGVPGRRLTDKIVQLHYLLTHIDCGTCEVCSSLTPVTNPTNQAVSAPQQN